MEKDVVEAKKYLASQGYGELTSFSPHLVAVLLANYKNNNSKSVFTCPCCNSENTYLTQAFHCNRCAVTTEI